MNKIIKTVLLLAVMIFVGLAFWTAKNKASFISDVCLYTKPEATSTLASLGCKSKLLIDLTVRNYKCSKIPQPVCRYALEKNSICDLKQKNAHMEGQTMEQCRLQWDCPELVNDYNLLMADCQGKPQPN